MDSLTQIVLGAAMGEVALGKKIGNRAMIWGGIGGTIPDLDVLSNFFQSEIDALAFHRGFTHSILFAIIAPFLLALFTKRLYDSNAHNNTFYKYFVYILNISLLIIITLAICTILNTNLFVNIIATLIIIGIMFWFAKSYLTKEQQAVQATYKEWYLLFFLSIFTHPLLDCFTSFGTQIFLPFSDYRVSLSTVSVADPFYTAPFLLCLLLAAIYTRTNKRRSILNWIGIAWSCLYLTFTVYNKIKVEQVFTSTLASRGISYQRIFTTPSIFNNILWQATIETDSAYYMGLYGLLDDKPEADFQIVPKNHHLLEPLKHTKEATILTWFSDNYYNIIPLSNNQLQFNDLRFGMLDAFTEKKGDYIFRFLLAPTTNETWSVSQIHDDPRNIPRNTFSRYINRIKGIKE